jgi:hypothetical protein
MKIKCTVCGNVGILEIRGNSQRIIHYQYVDDKRVLTKHLVSMGTNGNRVGTDGNCSGNRKPDISRESVKAGLKLEPSAGFGPATITLPR